jgi:4-diphosphocytidyl-2-C-methyl-D-erythritol kinase
VAAGAELNVAPGAERNVAEQVVQRVVAPAKLTLSLRVEGTRPDGYHELRAEMISVDLADELLIDPSGRELRMVAEPGSRAAGLSLGPDNLVSRALALVDRAAGVELTKRIPVQGGLGGGSSDAAAVLRWAGDRDLARAATLGGDVPFCIGGGRALVGGIGERVDPLPYEPRAFVLLVPPFGVDTGSVYRAWDRRAAASGGPWHEPPNDLAAPAIDVEPRLARWRDVLADATGRQPVLAGSGSTWFVEGEPAAFGLESTGVLTCGGEAGLVRAVRSVPKRWEGPEDRR